MMFTEPQIPGSFLFNPLKHHIGFIREFINNLSPFTDIPSEDLVRQIRHIGGSVTDVYMGGLSVAGILEEISAALKKNGAGDLKGFSAWAGTGKNDFRLIELSDQSQWTVKYHENGTRYVHLFPARSSPHSFRVKANTLKSAILYNIFTGKDFVTEEGLNKARAMAGLSPVKDVFDSEAITELIEMLSAQ
jgi:hypothetical protein